METKCPWCKQKFICKVSETKYFCSRECEHAQLVSMIQDEKTRERATDFKERRYGQNGRQR